MVGDVPDLVILFQWFYTLFRKYILIFVDLFLLCDLKLCYAEQSQD